MELEPSPITEFEPVADQRLRMPEPLPVRLVSVDDVRLPSPTGAERELDAFYVMLLGFEREDVELKRPRPRIEPLLGGNRQGVTAPPLALGFRNGEEPPKPVLRSSSPAGEPGGQGLPKHRPEGPVYRAENFRLRFHWVEPPVVRETLRVQGIEVQSLAEAEAKLIEAEIEYKRERGMVPGRESLLLQDPAGNWVELVAVVPA